MKAAVKIIPKEEQGLTKAIQKELTIHRGLQHVNISKFLLSREETECLYIFVEYAAAGELFDKIGKKDAPSNCTTRRQSNQGLGLR